MRHRLPVPILALPALVAACQNVDRSIAPGLEGPRFSLAASEGLKGRIAFHSTRDGDFEIFVMNADGSNVAQLTNNIVGDVDPIWSPDGQRIAFSSDRVGTCCEVFVMNADGTGETQLTHGGGFAGAWSPDGTQIAFVGPNGELFVMNADGTGVTQLGSGRPTAWSRDGQQIAFISDRAGNNDIYVMNADGTGVTPLTTNPASDEGDHAGWSPDGTKFVFSSTRDNNNLHIFVMNADGTGVAQLTAGDFVDDDPVWSPDGTQIAFHSTRDGGDEDIFVMNADGSGLTQLTFNDGIFDAVPVWIQIPPPANDAFANATAIATLPFAVTVDITGATAEADEPVPSCSFGFLSRSTAWYAFTAGASGVVEAGTRAPFSTVMAAYTGGSLGGLTQVACFSGTATFRVEAGTTYYFQVDGIFGATGPVELHLAAIPPPANDAFVDAIAITALPYSAVVDVTGASTETGEPTTPSCGFGPVNKTAWLTFTANESRSISASGSANAPFSSVVTVYKGSSLGNLTEVGCRAFGAQVTFRTEANATYYFQVGGFFGEGGPLEFRLEVTPPPVAGFGSFPPDPGTFDVVQFFDNSFDPGQVGFQSREWRFGDGTSTTTAECCTTHRYAADGDYTVGYTVTTVDGRTGSTSQTLLVRTHDVAITRFSVPNAASAGQTRRIVVGLTSKRYAETVEVQLFKSAPGGFQPIGALTQSVPVRPGGRTTDFAFRYTFTADDAQVGKVTFKAVANVFGARDALPADNTAIAPPTGVTR